MSVLIETEMSFSLVTYIVKDGDTIRCLCYWPSTPIKFSTSSTSGCLNHTGCLNHVSFLLSDVATCFKETALLFNVLIIILRILSCAQLANTCSKLTIKKIGWICWMCSKSKTNTAWHSSGVFIDFDQSQHINIMFLLLTLNKYFSVECESQVINDIIKVVRPISFSDLWLHRIEVNYEQMTILSTCYEHNMNICFSSKFDRNPKRIFIALSYFWSALSSLFPRDFTFFLLYQTENLFKLLEQWNKLIRI